MMDNESGPIIAERNAKTVHATIFMAIVMVLSVQCDMLTQAARACSATAVDGIMVYENDEWVDRTDQTIYVALHSMVHFWAVPFPEGSQWAQGHPIWSDDATGYTGEFIAITFDTAGTYEITTGPDTQTVTVVVVELSKLQWRLSGGTWADVTGILYVAKGTQVEFKAIKNPSSASWPSGKPVWTGATPDTPPDTAAATFNSVSSSSTDYKTVTCACGNTKTVNVVVVEIDKIQWKYHSQSTYSDAPEILYIAKDAQVDFKAIIKPDNSSWPSGQPVWSGSSGASGTGSEVSVTFSSISSSSSDYKTVICSCGNSITVNVVVYKVNLKQLSFDGTKYHAVKRDTGNQDDYSAPHWQDNSSPPDGDADDAGDIKYPISFTRNTKMKVTTVCRADPAIAGVTIKVKGDGPGNLDFPETTASISDNDITIANVECSNPFVNEIDYFESLSIAWQYSYDNGSTWVSAGSSTNQTYITLGDPTATTYHTVLHIGCKNADGKTDPAEIVASIWAEFTDLEVKRADDNATLSYWKNYPPTEPSDTLSGLLATGDGRCQCWSDFFDQAIKCQGISGSTVKVIIPKSVGGVDPVGIWVKNWDLSNTPPSAPQDLPGEPGQGNGDPWSKFFEHVVVEYGSTIYDPSYGKTFATLKLWQNGSLAGIAYTDGTVKKNPGDGSWLQLVEYQ